MNINIGWDVLNKETGEHIGVVAGIYHPKFYSEILTKGQHTFELWDKNYPSWRKYNVYIVFYSKPSRNLSRSEVAQIYDLTEDQVSDKLYEQSTVLHQYMVMPYESIIIVEPHECTSPADKGIIIT